MKGAPRISPRSLLHFTPILFNFEMWNLFPHTTNLNL